MTPAEASTQLCTCVFDCNVPLLRRYMKAGILVSAGNFDSRTALHVAAAEGNLAAVGTLVTNFILRTSGISLFMQLQEHRS